MARRAARGRERDRFFRLGPAPLAPRPERRLAPQEAAARWRRARARSRPSRRPSRSRTWRCASRRSRSSWSASARCCGGAGVFDFDAEVAGCRASSRRSRSSRCSSCAGRARSRSSRRRRSRRSAFGASRSWSRGEEAGVDRDRPLRLITAGPVDALARTVEALLVVASQPLSVDELAAAADDDPERIETALGLLGERFSRGPERDRARARRRRLGVPRLARGGGGLRRGCSSGRSSAGSRQAALETLAIVAYLGPVTGRRSRGSAASRPTRSSRVSSSAA